VSLQEGRETRDARLRAGIARIRERRLRGKDLRPEENAALAALDALERTEQDARTAFGHFLATAGTGDSLNDDQLPADVSLRLARWAAARKTWETESERLLALPVARGRSGPRPVWIRPETIELPTALPARSSLSALFSTHHWSETSGGDLRARVADQQEVWLDVVSQEPGAAETALREIARQGASAAQTYLALVSLWRSELGDAPRETYLTVYASDLLRWQGKKATPRGGYHKDDLLAKGRDIWLLSRIRVPIEQETIDDNGRKAKLRSVERLISLESLDALEMEGSGTSLLRFRFHPGRAAGAFDAEGATRSGGALLSYHPVRQKYQILLGFCLARRSARGGGSIPLVELLEDAAVAIPEARVAAFLTSIEDALVDLARDAVVPRLRLVKPTGWTDLLAARQAREILRRSRVEFGAFHRPDAMSLT
jgi:hypothetical protein